MQDGPALKLGLVDEVAPAGKVLEAAKRLALEIAGEWRAAAFYISILLDSNRVK